MVQRTAAAATRRRAQSARSWARGARQDDARRDQRSDAPRPRHLKLAPQPLNVGPGDCVYPAGLNRYERAHEVGSYGTAVLRLELGCGGGLGGCDWRSRTHQLDALPCR